MQKQYLDCLRNLINSTGWAAETAMDALKIPADEREAYMEKLKTSENDTVKKIGQKIKKIRNAKNLSLQEFADLINLPDDRVQRYENGYKKPGPEMTKEIAKALNVSPLAISEPALYSPVSAMYALFELADRYGLYIDRIGCDGPFKMGLIVDETSDKQMYEYMREWYEVYYGISRPNHTEADYNEWQWNFEKNHQ